MTVTRLDRFESLTATTAPTTAVYNVTPNIGDLVTVDVTTSTAATVAIGVSGGGVTSWVKVGTEVTSTSGFLVSTCRFMGVITSVADTTPKRTVTVTYAATPSGCKIDGQIMTEAALRPGVAWTVDADHSTKITTGSATLAGFALTSSGTNGFVLDHWCPAQAGLNPTTIPTGYTYNIDGGWTNVTAWAVVSATGTVAAVSARQSASDSYARRVTIIQAAASSTPVLLDGTAAAASSASGSMAVDRPLAGSAPSASSARGDLDRRPGLTGTAATASSASGDLGRVRDLAGTVAAASGASGALTRTVDLGGTAAATSSARGDLTVTADGSYGGTAAAASAARGDLQVTRPLGGTAATASAGTGALSASRPLAGTASSASSASGTLDRRPGMVGTAAAASVARGDLIRTAALAGTAAAASSASGALARDVALSGTAAAASSARGALAGVGSDLAGTAAAASGATGDLRVARPLAGVAAAASAATGDLTVGEAARPLPVPDDPLPPRARGWRPSPATSRPYQPPTVIYA